jgi:hypothetical protein
MAEKARRGAAGRVVRPCTLPGERTDATARRRRPHGRTDVDDGGGRRLTEAARGDSGEVRQLAETLLG